jgi:hypothetical protein
MLASAVVLGVAAGWFSGGKLGRLGRIQIHWWPLLVVAMALRLVAAAVGESLIAWLVAFAAIITVAWVNRGVQGMALIALGALLNLVVVVANGAMPVDLIAAFTAGVEIPADGLHRAMRESDSLTVLADRIPVPPIGRLYSAGDVLLAIGGFWVPFAWMRKG